jgi:hypothetical protein
MEFQLMTKLLISFFTGSKNCKSCTLFAIILKCPPTFFQMLKKPARTNETFWKWLIPRFLLRNPWDYHDSASGHTSTLFIYSIMRILTVVEIWEDEQGIIF